MGSRAAEMQQNLFSVPVGGDFQSPTEPHHFIASNFVICFSDSRAFIVHPNVDKYYLSLFRIAFS